jgi:peptidyl-prolyl cis-trans isomerase B (cyclophilin B)
MAKHKSPAQVTVAPLFEKSLFEKWVDKYKYPALGVLTAAVVWVIWDHYSDKAGQRKLDRSWETLTAKTSPHFATRLPSAPPDVLAGLAVELNGQESGPWARLLEIQARIDERDFDGALAALTSLRSDYPTHPIVTEKRKVEGREESIAEHLQRVAEQRKAWESDHSSLFSNPPPPEGSPRVKLKTPSGTIEVALYRELAPKHVENFLKLCKEGYYDGTKFHRVVRGFMIQGGDPNSRDKEPIEWGQGGPDYTVAPEPNDLAHFAGVLSAAKKPGDKEESGSQFFLTTDPAHHLDGEHTVFGQVVAGQDVVQAIGQSPTAPEGSRDRPLNPIAIESVEVVE